MPSGFELCETRNHSAFRRDVCGRVACVSTTKRYMEDLDGLASGSARVCGYSQCGAALEYDGRGRPPEYCADRRWPPDNKTCKQMAAAERAGERAAGLDAPLADFRATAERFAP